MQYQFGGISVAKVHELDSGLPLGMVFPEIRGEDLKRLRGWYEGVELTDEPATSEIRLSCHSYLVRTNGTNILIDTCNGNDKERVIPFAHRLDSPYLRNLTEAGVQPEDIDVVLCTHLHCDHVGWNTRLDNGTWVPTFPNARYLFTRLDYEFFSRHQDDAVHGPAYTDSILPVVERGLAHLIETDALVTRQLGDGVWLEGAPGHSPGSCLVHAQAGGELVVFSGDCFHHPIQLVRPDVHFFADHDPVEAAQTRKRLFETHSDASTVLFPAHFRGTSGGRIRRDGDAFRFEFLPPVDAGEKLTSAGR
jgi:glyoxylase-like metal-dependent hydrolase (beta-lactamase superfamily II)